jgi:hypothetical protein
MLPYRWTKNKDGLLQTRLRIPGGPTYTFMIAPDDGPGFILVEETEDGEENQGWFATEALAKAAFNRWVDKIDKARKRSTP